MTIHPILTSGSCTSAQVLTSGAELIFADFSAECRMLDTVFSIGICPNLY
jgi:hypothetical protein